MSALEFGLIFISGFISGLVAMGAAVMYVGGKAIKSSEAKLRKSIDNLANQLPNPGTLDDLQYAAIEPRMARIKEIAKLQMDLQAAHDGPQRNAMDGRYKNGLMGELKQLEEEKVNILNSIVNDGFDPPVNVLKEDGTTQVTKLSAFLAGYDPKLAGEKKADGPVRNVGRFVVHKGGKDDGGNTTTH
jgi:hypothetical protein